MPLDIKDGFSPVLRCDHCKELITEASKALAIWRPPQPIECHLAQHPDIYFLHEECNLTFQQTAFTDSERAQANSAPLTEFLTHLLANTGIAFLEAAIPSKSEERLVSALSQENMPISR
jgi:hypothetical protein